MTRQPMVTLLLIAMLSGGSLVGRPAAHGAQPVAPAYDVNLRPLGRIAPGTVVGDRAPQGWSVMVIKSQPRLGSGDVNQVADIVKSLASFLSITVLAKIDVDRASPRPLYELSEVAVGLGTRVGQQEIIINSDTQAQLGAGLGIIARAVLSNTEKELLAVNQVARSRTMLVFDVPSIALALRHAILIDAPTGRIATVVWLIDKNDAGNYTELVGNMNLIAPNTVEDRVLSVDANEFTVGIPSAMAFAIVRIPPGVPFEPSAALRPLAAAQRFTPESAWQLETGLRAMLSGGPARLAPRTAPSAASRTGS